MLSEPLIAGPTGKAAGLGALDAEIGVDDGTPRATHGFPCHPPGLGVARGTPVAHRAQASEKPAAVHDKAVTSYALADVATGEATGYEAARGPIVVNEQWLATGPEHVFLAVQKDQVEPVDRPPGPM